MGHTVYISFKTEDIAYKNAIQTMPNLDCVDRSLDEAIDSNNPDYILRRIRSEYLNKSTVTIFLIGEYSSEQLGATEQYYIKKELQASLLDSTSSPKSGILGIVLPSMDATIFGGSYQCGTCGGDHRLVRLDESTSIREFYLNYYIPNGKCSHADEDRYCVLTTWREFEVDPNLWVDRAFDKRRAPIASKTKVRP